MHPSPQPIVVAQLPLVSHWQAFYQAPSLRLSRWLTTEANRPLLHDYLLGLSSGPEAPVCNALAWDWAAIREQQASLPAAVIWLDLSAPETWAGTEDALRTSLASVGRQRFIVLEDAEKVPLQRLARWFPGVVHTATPAVSMDNLLADLATKAASSDSSFQQQFHQLSEAVAHLDSKAVEACAAACLRTCQSEGLLFAEMTVWLTVANYFLAGRQPDEARLRFVQASERSEVAFALGDTAAGLLSIQAWLGAAATWQQRGQTAKSIALLQQAVDRAEHLGAHMLGVEAARQLGVAFEQAGQHRAAVASYQRALQFAERQPPDQRPRSSIQALGKVYLQRLNTAPERQALRLRLAQLIG
ncbi:tetratricopeptide repeat protein [Hymenobacter crusticola]|uniref:Uncharacterized protein n=1 Tax=Hymenobacter crusticola TaxID=1770526 RepID=A0A243WGC3_9BACT|nr:tetratricopeptide repeat protein [Hymenobacter crusticola]OUJ74794.1 hypothetical protein BXP70_08545 [Hymenobacter crusticola]